MSLRKSMSTGTLTLTLVAITLSVAVTPASAKTLHALLGRFGQFGDPTGVAIDQANGNVYVVNGGGPEVVDVFNEAGEPTPVGGAPHELTGAGTPAGSFNFGFYLGELGEYVSGVAVDNTCYYQKLTDNECELADSSNGDVYVTNPLYHVVDKFRVNNLEQYEFVCEFTGYTSGGGAACLPGSVGQVEEFGRVDGVAVDSHGNVYVTDYDSGMIDEYNSSGEDLAQIASPVTHADQIVVAPSGNMYVREFDEAGARPSFSGRSTVVELKRNSLGQVVSELPITTEGRAVGFDSFTSNVIIPLRSEIAEFDTTGDETGVLFGGAVENTGGVDANAGTGDVYVSDREGQVGYIFGPQVTIPTVSTEGFVFADARRTSVALSGSVDPEGTAVSGCEFEYGPSAFYGSKVPCETSPGAGNGAVSVSATVVGLKPGTTYHYRLGGSYGAGQGTGFGVDKVFKTIAAVEDSVAFASSVTPLGATLNATIDPGELPTSYHFVYGTSAAYGAIAPVPDVNLPLGYAEDPVSQSIEGLKPDTTYHFAVVANSSAGAVVGPDQTFTTPPVPTPAVVTGASSEVTVGAATLSGSIDPQGWETGYYFEYGPTTSYGSRWPTVDVALGGLNAAQPVVTAVQNLQPATVYHYRLVASNAGGVVNGADQTFTTAAYPVSVVQEAPLLKTPVGITVSSSKSSGSKPLGRGRHKRRTKVKRRSAGGKRHDKAGGKRKKRGG